MAYTVMAYTVMASIAMALFGYRNQHHEPRHAQRGHQHLHVSAGQRLGHVSYGILVVACRCALDSDWVATVTAALWLYVERIGDHRVCPSIILVMAY